MQSLVERDTAGELPPVLVDPVWAARTGYAAPTVISGLVATVGNAADWLPGERESWACTWLNWESVWEDPEPARMSACVSLLVAGRLLPDVEPKALVKGAAEDVRPMLARWTPKDLTGAALWMRVVIARFGGDAVPPTLRIAAKLPAVGGELLAPLTGPGVAGLMADWLVRVPAMRTTAEGWFARHPAAAAAALVPVALGELGPARAAAREALRSLAERGERHTVLAGAGEHGPAVVDATRDLLGVDRGEQPPAWLPKPPGWLTPDTLPPVVTTVGGTLPEDAIRVLCGLLALPDIDDIRRRIPALKRDCDQASLAAFGWALLEQWQAGKAPGKDAWVVTAVGLLGDDDTVAKLVARLLAWVDEGRTVRAVKGLEALAAIGTDVALTHVERLSRTAKSKKLKGRAGELITAIAADRELSQEQLADRVVPTFGLDATGSLSLDYGGRRFTVGFDEQLKPWVAEEDGTRRANLPRPAARDGQGIATAAYDRFAALKKDVRAIAAEQLRRLERAMLDQRRWSADEIQRLLVGHPLLWHLARRLVWATLDDDGRPLAAFRVAEDRSFADVQDDEFVLPPDASVGIPHPVHLGDQLPAWSEMFADYEILQPFPQLGRGVFAFGEREAGQRELTRFAGIEVPTGKVLGLRSRGWTLTFGDGGGWDTAELTVAEDRIVRIGLSPGIDPGRVAETPRQTLSPARLAALSGDAATRATSFADLPPLAASELLRDLHDLTA